MAATRQARLRAYAKLNLDLKVLNRGADGFHELRSVFQTVSIHDTLEIAFTPGRRTELTLDGSVDIPDNLVLRAARLLLDVVGDHVPVPGRRFRRRCSETKSPSSFDSSRSVRTAV